jgi:hypothetical protein
MSKITTYYSRSNGKWRLIHQGMPLCPDRDTLDECKPVAAQYNVTPSASLWDGDVGAFIPMSEALDAVPKQSVFDVEVTDTFGGEANYCWVHRHRITVPVNAKRAQVVRAAKAAEGWTGIQCETEDNGDYITLRPRGLLQVMFITYAGSAA